MQAQGPVEIQLFGAAGATTGRVRTGNLPPASIVNVAIVAKSPLPRILEFGRERGWRFLRLLSTAGNDYDRDYFGDSTALTHAVRKQQEFKPGEEWDMPILNVFRRDVTTIRHVWESELLYVPPEPGQEYRHNDLIDPAWTFLDLMPEGRGNFEPKLEYR
ncbi:MAG: DUF899 domain-containing protein [Alphaproteobacteria bacterium]|nr:DUF899 domain-containing protein [Alphaproteobacteria bacterium]